MALFKTRSAAVYGIDAHPIDVEVDLYSSGTARDFVMVGMPDVAVRESRERIKSALMNSGFGFPNKAVTINLAPADVRKEGAGFDLPMASYPNNGAQIRVASPFQFTSGADDTQILDMTLGTPGNFNDAALLVGQSYTDSTYGISINVLSATPSALTLSVSEPGGVPRGKTDFNGDHNADIVWDNGTNSQWLYYMFGGAAQNAGTLPPAASG